MVTVEQALAQLTAQSDAQKATEMQAYHKTARRFLGVPMPLVDPLVAEWRAACSLEDRTALAAGLWASDIHEAMIAATWAFFAWASFVDGHVAAHPVFAVQFADSCFHSFATSHGHECKAAWAAAFTVHNHCDFADFAMLAE